MSAIGSAPPFKFPPLQLNPRTGELFLQLAHPHTDIIITPPRSDDAPLVTEVLSDYAVNKNLTFPPWPFQPLVAETWLASVRSQCDPVINTINVHSHNQPEEYPSHLYFDGPPVAILREMKDKGSDTFLGAIRIMRSAKFQYLRDEQKDQALREKNESREAGDPEIIWEIAYFMRSSHQGRGIMSSAVHTLIHDWAKPYMNARCIRGVVHTGNEGSSRVFQKNGFRQFDLVDDLVEVAASKGGGRFGLYSLELEL